MESSYCLPAPATESAYCTFLRGYAETPMYACCSRDVDRLDAQAKRAAIVLSVPLWLT